MNGFRTARALVVDDVPKHAIAVLQALGALGMGAVYYDGEFERQYDVKLGGIRLLLLDMVLENRGATEGDEKNVVSILMGALQQVMAPSPGFVVIICWTRHKNIHELISAAFKDCFPCIHLIEVILLEKKDYIDLDSGQLLDMAKFSALIESVKLVIEKSEPAGLLSGWEQLVHNAATTTTGAIYNEAQSFANSTGKTWHEGAYAVCAALAIAERGSRVAQEESFFVVKGLTDALGPLLLDRIEHYGPGEISITDLVKDKLLNTAKAEATLSKSNESLLLPAQRASLNSSLNLSLRVTATEICPGNLYLMVRQKPNREITKQHLPIEVWRDLTDDTFIGLNGNAPGGHYPIFLEVSPACDFAQEKGKMPRFLGGFLIPVTSTAPFRGNTAHLRTVSYFSLTGVAEVTDVIYRLVINAHYLVSLPPSIAGKLAPFARLRSAILADQISWLAGRISQPGFVQVTPVPSFPVAQEDLVGGSGI